MEDGEGVEGGGNSWGITAHLLLPLNKLCKFNTLQGAKHPIRANHPTADSCSAGTQYYIHPCITMNGKDSGPALLICGCPNMKTEVTLSTISPAFPSRQERHTLLIGAQNLSRTKSVHCCSSTVPIEHSITDLICSSVNAGWTTFLL